MLGTIMVNPPTVSILMPVYNASAYLAEAVTSILRQTFSDFELIIINDGSSDNSLNIISNFLSDTRIRVINNPKNLGLICSLHKGLFECKGKYIARMDADDICDLQRLERQTEFLNKHDEIDILGGAIQYFGKTRKPFIYQFPLTHDAIWSSMLFFCPLAHPTIMFRRTLIDNKLIHFDNNYKHAEDYHLWSKLLKKIRAANLMEVVLHYRLHESQVSSEHSNHQYSLALKVRKELLTSSGVTWSKDELFLHESVILGRPVFSQFYLENLANWFRKIEESNSQSGFWNPDSLHAILRDKFVATAFLSLFSIRLSDQTGSNITRYVNHKAMHDLNTFRMKCYRLLRRIRFYLVKYENPC